MSQLGGGIGTRGPGETKLETDRRRIQRRLVQLRSDLEAVRRVRGQQRQRREAVPVPTIALVGYTNAGKSTLFNQLTHADVLESARMFATLDPKLKALTLPSRRKILLSDTVGFIRDLPHTLIEAFQATLQEAADADLLLHVVDGANPEFAAQMQEVQRVLAEIGAAGVPQIVVFNKLDRMAETERPRVLADMIEVDGARVARVFVSARSGEGLDALRERIAAVASGTDLNAAPAPASHDVGDADAAGASEDPPAGRTGTYHSHA
jgi:GTP-binding protein HflX